MPPRVLVVSGTRPELIKLWPLLEAFKEAGIQYRHVFTGQHTSLVEQMGQLGAANTLFDPDTTTFLNVPGTNDPITYVQLAHDALRAWWPTETAYGLVVVQGDTASALAGARFGAFLDLPVAHVEAGLRTHDTEDPWPEEAFRTEIDRLSTFHYAPTHANVENLVAERLTPLVVERLAPLDLLYPPVGNTVTDALRLAGITPVPPGRRANRLIVTLHRRESFGAPMMIIAQGIANFAARHGSLEVLWPLHPNPNVADSIRNISFPPNVRLTDPLPYHTFTTLLANSRAAISDSGGITEEATTLGVPVCITRNKTERPEAIQATQAVLAPPTSPKSVETMITHALMSLSPSPSTIYGTGHTSQSITQHILSL